MLEAENFDVVILGSGQGGKRLAWHLGRAGKKVAVVERQWVGGSCPAVACLPSKNKIWGARVAHLVRNAAHFGINVENAGTNMARVQRRKSQMVDLEIELHVNLYKKSGAELIMGTGRFIAPKTVEVTLNDGGVRVLKGEDVVVNVGTHAALPDVPGLKESRPMTHIEILELDMVPPHLVVLGGGYIGVEMAQAYRRFGSKVTIIEPSTRIMGREDGETAAEIAALLEREEIDVRVGSKPIAVTGTSGDAIMVTVETETGRSIVEGSHLMVAVGRVPNTNDIGLETAGIALTDRGFIQVDEHLRTTASGIWAIGESAGSPQFTHVSVDDFRVVRDNMEGRERRTHDRLVPHVMFTDPPLARVGLSETEARRIGIAYRVARLPMRQVLRTFATDESDGFMKVLIGADDQILGFTMIGSEAGEVMAVVQTAMLAGLAYTKLRDVIFAHLTMAEGLGPLLEAVPAPQS